MNTIEDNRRDIITYTADITPVLMEDDSIDIRRYHKIPLDKVTSLGVGMTPLINTAQTVINGGGGSGLYMVTVPNNGTMLKFKDGSAYLGSAKAANGGVGGGQARLNQVPMDPSMVFMAATIYCMQRKLDAIQETQEEILQFLEQREKAELKGNIVVLSDILENFKYNWNSAQWLSSNHNKVLDIKQKSEQSIIFAQTRITEILNKKKLVKISTDVNAKVKKIGKAFEDYQLASYAYAFAAYVETILLQNFDKGYMYSIASKIENYSIRYRELYTDCYNALAEQSDRSIDTVLIDGFGKISKAAGDAIAKIPVISKSELDENLIAVGDIISESGDTIRSGRLAALVSKQNSYVVPFIDNIKMIGELHDKPLKILFDEENLYFEKVVA